MTTTSDVATDSLVEPSSATAAGPGRPTRPPRVVFLVNDVDDLKLGGAALRWAALEAGLAKAARATRISVACPGPDSCAHAPAEKESPYPESIARAAPFHSTFCATAAKNLTDVLDRIRPDVVVASGRLWIQTDVSNAATVAG